MTQEEEALRAVRSVEQSAILDGADPSWFDEDFRQLCLDVYLNRIDIEAAVSLILEKHSKPA